MTPRLTPDGHWTLARRLYDWLHRPATNRELTRYAREIEASVARALTPTAELRSHAHGTCRTEYVMIPESEVEWVS